MNLGLSFFFTNAMLGVGLAMDAFSVSLANGLNEPKMSGRKMVLVAGIFAAFQTLMPLTGWFCVTALLELFSAFEPFIPWIALILLCFIGGKMLWEGIRGCGEGEDTCGVGLGALMVQGVATSIDALSVGFTIAHYNVWEALLAAALIGGITFFICALGLEIGKKAGTKLAGKAGIFGGAILIFIGIEIFVSSWL
jgi:putative Mn2+ efflux pump MntP